MDVLFIGEGWFDEISVERRNDLDHVFFHK